MTDLPCLEGLRVLVVDNNIDCCNLLDWWLQSYGVEVKKAFSAEEALKIFIEWQPDLLVSNVALPKVDGFCLVKQARLITAERKTTLLVIAVTAYITQETRQFALSNGFDFWFSKPLNLDDLLTVVAYSSCKPSSSSLFEKTVMNLEKSYRI